MTQPKTYLSPPTLSGNEVKYVTEAIESGWIAPLGPFVTRFENELCKISKTKFCLSTSSGTAALHLALLTLGVEKDDEVLCSDLTFVASVNAILYCNATPILIDSESTTWNMCPKLLRTAIVDRIKLGKKPKALLLVHLYGMPAQMDEILAICEEFDIPMIEDAAEALGSSWDGKPLGSLGDIGVYSFNGNKIITTSGGGAMVSNNSKYINRARFLSTQAKDESVAWFEHPEMGYNYRLSNVLAALGCAQLEGLEERVKFRRDVFDNYVELFNGEVGVSWQIEPEKAFSNRWLSVALLDEGLATPAEWAERYQEENIETRPMWKPMHMQKAFRDMTFYANGVGEELFLRGICLANRFEFKEINLK